MARQPKQTTLAAEVADAIAGGQARNLVSPVPARWGNEGMVGAKGSRRTRVNIPATKAGDAEQHSKEAGFGAEIGAAICASFGTYDRGVFGLIEKLFGHSTIAWGSAYAEVEKQRTLEVAAVENDDSWESDKGTPEQRLADVAKTKASAINTIRASFSRPITVLKFGHLNSNAAQLFEGCETLTALVAVARSLKKPKGGMSKPFTAEGFAAWLSESKRIVDLTLWTRDEHKGDADKKALQVQRYETALKALIEQGVNIQAKVGGLLSVPVLELAAMVSKPLAGRGKVRMVHRRDAEVQPEAKVA